MTITDFFGMKEPTLLITSKSIEGAETFLKLVCAPALGEIGLMAGDKARHWRLCNVLKMIELSKGKLEFRDDKLQIKADPRVGLAIIEESSKIENLTLQELWAGLFAASCKREGQDDENLIFVNILKLLTVAQAKLLNYICRNATKVIHPNGLVSADILMVTGPELIKIMGIMDIHRIDRELDYLRSLELVSNNSGFDPYEGTGHEELIAEATPTSIALNLYMKGQGYAGSIQEYWKHSLVDSNTIV